MYSHKHSKKWVLENVFKGYVKNLLLGLQVIYTNLATALGTRILGCPALNSGWPITPCHNVGYSWKWERKRCKQWGRNGDKIPDILSMLPLKQQCLPSSCQQPYTHPAMQYTVTTLSRQHFLLKDQPWTTPMATSSLARHSKASGWCVPALAGLRVPLGKS
jgi:hypothetical protein